tara:strand:+ start:3786 stop:4073 length:288 start_codon:yes stop_codon:yes gene_type:complete
MNKKKQSGQNHKLTEENLVQDLKKTLEDTIEETKSILVDLEQTVEATFKDQSISDKTKKIVNSISNEVKNSTVEESQNNINASKTPKDINNLEEE